MKTYERKAKFTELKPYCHMAKEDDYIEMTEWGNGEGFEINIATRGQDQTISLTWGQWEAVQAIVAYKE